MARRGFLVLAACCLLAVPSVTKANVFADAWGIMTDPLKLDSGTENVIHAVERAAIHAERLQGNLDEDVRDYLWRIDKMIGETRRSLDQNISDIGVITDNAFNRMSALEKDFFSDTRDLIKCGGEVTFHRLQTTLAKSLNDLGKRKPRLEIFGITFLSVEIEASDIASPISAFREIKAAYDDRLSDIKPTDHPSRITDIYGEMQRLADLARCHYKQDNALYQELYWYELEYNRLGRAWEGLVKPL